MTSPTDLKLNSGTKLVLVVSAETNEKDHQKFNDTRHSYKKPLFRGKNARVVFAILHLCFSLWFCDIYRFQFLSIMDLANKYLVG